MMIRTACFGVVIIMATLLSACRRDDSSTTSKGKKGTYIESSIQLVTTVRHGRSGSTSNSGVLAYLHNLDSARVVDGGTVTINGSIVPKWYDAGSTWYQTRDTFNIPVSYDGSMNRFQVSGGAGFPSFSDSCPSPNGLTSITYPTISDTVSKASGFNVTWSGNVASDWAEVQVSDTAFFTKHPMFFKILSSDPGTLRISSSDLDSMYTGPIEITVARRNEKRVKISISKRMRMMVATVDIVHAYLK